MRLQTLTDPSREATGRDLVVSMEYTHRNFAYGLMGFDFVPNLANQVTEVSFTQTN